MSASSDHHRSWTIVLLVAITALAVLAWHQRRSTDPAQVFDSAVSLIARHHFDPAYGEAEAAALRSEFGLRASAVTSMAELYAEVLWPMTERFPHSHLDATPPEGMTIPAGFSLRMRAPRRGDLFPASIFPAFEGLGGALIVHDGDDYQVIAVEPGSPAARAGVSAGAPTTDISVQEVPSDDGTTSEAHLRQRTVSRGEHEIKYRFRPEPAFQGVSSTDTGDGVRVLRFDEFRRRSADDVIAAVRTAPSKGLIVDLRRNIGGEIAVLRRIAGALLPAEGGLGRMRRRNGSEDLLPAVDGPIYGGPVVVMISSRTSSAAEILTVALRHHRQAVVVGDRSAGRVMVADSFRLPDGGSLSVPTASFTGADGGDIEGVGVVPDRIVRLTAEAGQDPHGKALETALTALRAPVVTRQPAGSSSRGSPYR